MIRFYTDKVMWRGQEKSKDWLHQNHENYLDKINYTRFFAYDFNQKFHSTGEKAIVKCNYDLALKKPSGKEIKIKFGKRFRLTRKDSEWKIECEEVIGKHRSATDTCGF